MRLAISSSALLAVSLFGGCEGSAPAPPRRGVPDPTHGPVTDADIDGDGVPNEADNCPSLANADQRAACEYPLPPPPASGEPAADAIARINFWRDVLGLDPVQEDADLSRGCAAHVHYLAVASRTAGMPILTREEDPGSPQYTPHGAEAGQNGLLGYGAPDAAAAVSLWLDLAIHRLPLIHPGLRRVGVGFEERFVCVRADRRDAVAAPHPIAWPPPDSSYANPVFPGGESPCVNAPMPTMADACEPGGLVASLGLHGHALAGVSASIRRVDTGEEIPLQHTLFAGGPSALEQSDLLEGTIVVAPAAGTTIAPTEHEVRIDAMVDGTPRTYRWRFRAGPAIEQDRECDVFRRMNFSFERAIDVTPASFAARICGDPMFYRIRDPGTYRVTLDYDPRFGDLDLVVYDAARTPLFQGGENDGHEVFDAAVGHGFFEVRGVGGSSGGYVVLVEAR